MRRRKIGRRRDAGRREVPDQVKDLLTLAAFDKPILRESGEDQVRGREGGKEQRGPRSSERDFE
jgi:hypothetical protein